MFSFPVTATIPATKSHKERTVVYKPSTDPKRVEDGILKVHECIGSRVKRLVTEEYLVQELPAVGYCGREWLVVKQDTKGLEGTVKGFDAAERCGNVYECRILADGLATCTCTAGHTKSGACVHELAIKAIIAVGGMPDPRGNYDADTGEVFEDRADIFDEAGTVTEWQYEGLTSGEWADDNRPTPPDACMYPPGSEKRLAVEAERVKAGFAATHPNDIPF